MPRKTAAHDVDLPSEVKWVIMDGLGLDAGQLKTESRLFEDLGVDSMRLVELILALEEAFEIDIPDEESIGLRTVQDVVDYIVRRVSQTQTPLKSVRHYSDGGSP